MSESNTSPGETGRAENAVPGLDRPDPEGDRRAPFRADVGWPRAVASGLAVVVVGFFGAVVGPNAILTRSLALTRGARELLATLLFFAVIVILAVALRWLQHRGVI
jgi:flagellin-like protein